MCARLRSAGRGAAHGVVAELERIVRRLREAWPQVRITVRGDSGFCNDELMVWCEAEGIDYVLGLAKNDRLKRRIETEMEVVRQLRQASGKAVRQFQELRYRTRKTWSCERRVVAKVEHLLRGEMKVSRLRGRFISAVYVGLGCNTPSVGGEQDFLPLNVNGHRKYQGFGH